MVIESDASRLGWGATLKGQGLRTGGQWLTSKQEMHINCLELLAASLAIQAFAKEKRNIRILVRTDNVSTRAYIAKSLWGDSLMADESLSHADMEVVHGAPDILDSRASPRSTESESQRGVKSNKGPLRLDAPPTIVLTDLGVDGSPRSRHVCIPSHAPTPTLLQLEAGPSSRSNGCICSRLESFRWYANPPWCLILYTYTGKDSAGESQSGLSGSNVEDTTHGILSYCSYCADIHF